MQTPHESVLLNEKRGLLAAVTGNPIVYPGIVDVYDLNEDCRNPVAAELAAGRASSATRAASRPTATPSTRPRSRTGHITAVDLTNPKVPMIVAVGELQLARPDDLRRRQPRLRRRQPGPVHPRHERDPGAQAGPAVQGGLPSSTGPSARSRRSRSPITIGGRPYLVEIDEFSSAEDDDSTAANGPEGRRRADHRHRRRDATRRSSPTSASRCTSARTAR